MLRLGTRMNFTEDLWLCKNIRKHKWEPEAIVDAPRCLLLNPYTGASFSHQVDHDQERLLTCDFATDNDSTGDPTRSACWAESHIFLVALNPEVSSSAW